MTFDDLNRVAGYFRQELEGKKYLLLYGHNNVGKTRLSMEFKDIGKRDGAADTLYFNAFTEDLFTWDNDLANDNVRVLRMNSNSRFFTGLEALGMEQRIRDQLQFYANFDFRINYNDWTVSFFRDVGPERNDNIKVSRGEEKTFIWCFFLARVQIVMEGEIDADREIRYIYIDDPVSSLDEYNAIDVAHRLARLLKENDHPLKTVISSHHTLFFNVMCNELRNAKMLFLGNRINQPLNVNLPSYVLRPTGETPRFHHVATLMKLHQAMHDNELYTYHFNMLRTILEKTASFHGFEHFSACFAELDDDPDRRLHTRLINVLSHGNYSLFEPEIMSDEYKNDFKMILEHFLRRYQFNPDLFTVVV